MPENGVTGITEVVGYDGIVMANSSFYEVVTNAKANIPSARKTVPGPMVSLRTRTRSGRMLIHLKKKIEFSVPRQHPGLGTHLPNWHSKAAAKPSLSLKQ